MAKFCQFKNTHTCILPKSIYLIGVDLMKPVIGIVGKPSMEVDMWHYMGIVDDIRYVLIKNDALAVGFLPSEKR